MRFVYLLLSLLALVKDDKPSKPRLPGSGPNMEDRKNYIKQKMFPAGGGPNRANRCESVCPHCKRKGITRVWKCTAGKAGHAGHHHHSLPGGRGGEHIWE